MRARRASGAVRARLSWRPVRRASLPNASTRALAATAASCVEGVARGRPSHAAARTFAAQARVDRARFSRCCGGNVRGCRRYPIRVATPARSSRREGRGGDHLGVAPDGDVPVRQARLDRGLAHAPELPALRRARTSGLSLAMRASQ